MEMALKILQELFQNLLKKTNSGLEILIFSPVRGMFDGRTDLTG
jgi:hypothetical protein